MFSIRGLSLAEAMPPGYTISVPEILGAQFEFRKGISISLKLPSDPAAFANLTDPEVMLSALRRWERVYRYPKDNGHAIHVLAPAEDASGELSFRRLDLWQRRKLHGPKPPVEVTGGAVMNYDDCASWLVELADKHASHIDYSKNFVEIARSNIQGTPPVRLAWIGPDHLDGHVMSRRLTAIGKVYNSVLVQIAPISFAHIQAQLKLSGPFHTMIICRQYATYIGAEVLPFAMPANLVHFCDSLARTDLEQQIRTWLDVAIEIGVHQQLVTPVDETKLVLGVILQGMLSHSKIGPNNHCPRETVLKRIRGRHLNAANAGKILDDNSEKYEGTKDSACVLLWKDHNDGPQYFLNPKLVPQIKVVVASITSSNGNA